MNRQRGRILHTFNSTPSCSWKGAHLRLVLSQPQLHVGCDRGQQRLQPLMGTLSQLSGHPGQRDEHRVHQIVRVGLPQARLASVPCRPALEVSRSGMLLQHTARGTASVSDRAAHALPSLQLSSILWLKQMEEHHQVASAAAAAHSEHSAVPMRQAHLASQQ